MRGVHRDEPMRPVELDALAAKVVEHHLDQGERIKLVGSTTAPLPCRATQLERAIANLVENALHYAGSADVEIGETEKTAWIAVLDRGPGVPEHLIPRLTEPFFRVDASRSRESGGAGLGLAIVKDIVEAHGGLLKISNRNGGGLEARIELPRS
jgi:signal transduction histidine kinase